MSRGTLAQSALALRRAFDRSFVEAPAAAPQGLERLLAVRVGESPYAISVAEIEGLYTDRRIVELPGSVAALLGLAGFRGRILPVYDLAALLGATRHASARWVVLARRGERAALAFEAFESQLVVAPEEIIAPPAGSEARAHVRGAVRTRDGTRPLIDLRSVLEEIERRAAARLKKEEEQP